MKKMVSLVAMTLLCGTSATAGMSHKVFKNPPAQVFEAAVRVGQRGHDADIDAKRQTVSFSTGSSGAYLGVNRLTVFLSGLPEGCGKDKPCTATEAEVKCIRVHPDTMGFRLCNGDVQRFFGRLRKELNKLPAPRANQPAPSKQ